MIFKQKLFLFFFYFTFVLNVSFSQESKSIEKISDSATYYYYSVINPKSNSDLVEAYSYYKNTKDKALTEAIRKDAIYSLRQIAIIQYKLGFLYDCEKSATEALKLVDELPINETTNESLIGLYNQLGKVNRELLNYQKAIDYYSLALKMEPTETQKIILKNNVAYAHLKAGDLIIANNMLEVLLKESKSLNDSVNMARILDNLGIVKGELKNPNAINYFKEALQIRKKLKNTSEIIGSYLDISTFYRRINKIDSARFYAYKSYELARQTKNANIIENSLGLIVGLKDDKEVTKYKYLVDSINNSNLLIEGKYASKKYEFEKQEKIARENQLKAEKEKNLKLIYGYTSILLLVVGLIAYYMLRQRHQKQKQIEVYNTELRISKKVHDEVANDVYHVMTKFQQNTSRDEDVLDDLEQVYNKTRDISREFNNLQLDEDFRETLEDLISNFNNNERNVITKNMSTINWEKVTVNKKITIYRVIQELLTNMRKHSLAKHVVLSFEWDRNKIKIEYKDNGIGCNLKKQNGLHNTENRIHANNGSIIFKTNINEGFNAIIRI